MKKIVLLFVLSVLTFASALSHQREYVVPKIDS